MKVVGLDLSLTATGVASVDTAAVLAGITRPHHYATLSVRQTGLERLHLLRQAIEDATSGADIVAIEGYSFGSKNSQAHALGELGGIVKLELWSANQPFVVIPPANVKRFACGKGNAKKEEVFAAAIRRLSYKGDSPDEADALWLAAMTLHHYGAPLAEMPQAHLDGLKKIEWPDLELAA